MPKSTDPDATQLSKTHRVLMIAAAFPPSGGPGVQRSAKFAKYLPQFGWSPTVWTMDRLEGLPEDITLLDDLSDAVRIQRWNRGKTSKRMQKYFARRANGRGWFSKLAKGISWRMEQHAAQNQWPDDCVGWAKASEPALSRFVQEESFDLIYSTYSPVSNHLLGLALKQETGLPWVADFRDLWTKDFRYHKRPTKWRADDAHLEQQILENADLVIGVTREQTAILADQLPDQKDKFITITNGFDPEDFAPSDQPKNTDTDWFVMSHVGRLDVNCANDSWFEGLQRFVTSLGGNKNSFHLRIIGHADKPTLEKLKQTGVWYAFTGYESHARAIQEMKASDAVLLLVSDKEGAENVIPAKLFEYLASQRPVLLSGPDEGACVDIVRRSKAGLSVGPDAQEVAGALQRMHNLWSSGKPMNGSMPCDYASYSRIALTEQLASTFNELIETGSETPLAAPDLATVPV